MSTSYAYGEYIFKTQTAGDDWDLAVNFPMNITGWTISPILLKRKIDDPDSAKVATINLTRVSENPGRVVYNFTSTITASLEKEYYGKIVTTSPAGKKKTWFIGFLSWCKR